MSEPWRQEGVGPHKTMAGNMFDPMVEADGQKGGIGVGGTSSERVREEGLEHIKKHYPEDSINPAGGSNMTPSSNTGEPSGGKLYGAGGVAGGAMAGGSSSNTGNYLGMSGGNTGYEQGRDAAPAYTSSSEVPGSRSEGFTGNAAAASARANNDPTTGPPPTESGGDPFTAATRRGMMTSGDSNLADEHPNESLEKADKPLPPGGTPSHKLDNPSSIPTAGGERLGNKHWGESDMVPDNPKPRESAAGISSSEGQPDKSTSDNTARNTGGAVGGPQHLKDDQQGQGQDQGQGEEKVGMMDKIKDKLHMG